MPRLPRYAHPQAARRSTGKLSWRPGWQGTGQQPIRRVPVAAYTRLISGVPLNGGQVQGIVPGYPAASGSVTSPGAFDNIAGPITVTVGGTFTIGWTVGLAGSLSSGDANNFALVQNFSTVLATSVNTDTAGTYPQAPVTVTLAAGDTLLVGNTNSATSGAVYTASIQAASLPLSLSVGPQGLGTVWYPIQVTLSTSAGLLDTATAAVYLGPAVTPATLVGQAFGGNGTVALAIPSMTPGQTLIITWSNAAAGEVCAANVIGTMSALSTQ